VNIEELIEYSITKIIGGEDGLTKKIDMLIEKHTKKVHFIPIKYRVLGGFLQSLNIKFGEFIETLLDTIISNDPSLQVISDVSGATLTLEIEENCERFIDEYIDNPIKNRDEILKKLPLRLNDLYHKIFLLQNSSGRFNKRIFDVNVLFKANDGTYYYVETKYNDDHDTGKFQDINRKFLKTYAGLVRYFKFRRLEEFKPILYYFNPSIRYNPNPYLRENIEILRGKKLFEKFNMTTSYDQIEAKILQLGEILNKRFDDIMKMIFHRVEKKINRRTPKTLNDIIYK